MVIALGVFPDVSVAVIVAVPGVGLKR